METAAWGNGERKKAEGKQRERKRERGRERGKGKKKEIPLLLEEERPVK
jgi:hypothetical protein